MRIIMYDDIIIKDSFPDNVEIIDSYLIRNTKKMKKIILYVLNKRSISLANRTMSSCIIEWHLHNIGYYVFRFAYSILNKKSFKTQMIRCKNVDLNKH